MHDPIGDDKLFLIPSRRRPLRRDLLRLVERFRREPGAEAGAMTGNGNGRLRQILEAAAREACLPLSDLTVLDKKVDPYRQDTPAGHRDGAWLAEQMARLGIAGPIHLRGLHYALVSSTSLTKPNGARYLNDAD